MPNTSNSANQYTQEGVDEILTQLGGLQQYGGKFAESNHFQNANLGKALGVFGALLNTGAASFENNPMKAVMAQKVPGFAKGGEGGGLGGGGMGSLMETFLGSLAPLLGENGALVSEIPEDKDLYRQNGWSDVMTNSQAVAWALERGDITQSEAEWLMRWMDESSFQPYDWVIGSGGIQEWDASKSDLTAENKRIVSKFINSISPNWYKPGTEEFHSELKRYMDHYGQKSRTDTATDPNGTNGGGNGGDGGKTYDPRDPSGAPPPAASVAPVPPVAPPPGMGQGAPVNGQPVNGQPPVMPMGMQPPAAPGSQFWGAPPMQPPMQPPVPRGQQQPNQFGMVSQSQPYMGRGFWGGM